jgi:hypothetical protein
MTEIANSLKIEIGNGVTIECYEGSRLARKETVSSIDSSKGWKRTVTETVILSKQFIDENGLNEFASQR